MERVDKVEDIWEFDFKQFFPSVDSGAISEVLYKEARLPKTELYFLQDMFKKQPHLHEEGSECEKLDESQTRKKIAISKVDETGVAPPLKA